MANIMNCTGHDVNVFDLNGRRFLGKIARTDYFPVDISPEVEDAGERLAANMPIVHLRTDLSMLPDCVDLLVTRDTFIAALSNGEPDELLRRLLVTGPAVYGDGGVLLGYRGLVRPLAQA